MRNPQWTSFSKITMGEVTFLLGWLDRQSGGKVSLNTSDISCPIRGEKLRAMAQVLTTLGFIFDRTDYLKVRHDGSLFFRSDFGTKMAMLREKIRGLQPAGNILKQLEGSASGRMRLNQVKAHFLQSLGEYQTSDLQGFMNWARMCELFYYDPLYDEIFQIRKHLPRPKSGFANGVLITTRFPSVPTEPQ